MNMTLNSVQEVKDILKSKIFTVQHKGTYLFDEDTYAILPGNISLYLKRSDVVWGHIKPTHKYAIFQYESNFIFRTFRTELQANENEFFLSIHLNADNVYTVTFTSIKNKEEQIRLISE